MTKKPNIAVIAGGNSSEYIVSVKSGANVYKAIDTSLFTPWLVHIKEEKWNVVLEGKNIPIDKSDFSFMLNNKKITFDFAYITIHGTPGEDGILQGYFELLNIPCSTCNLHSSSLTFNKWFCNNYLKSFDIKMANAVKISKGENLNSESVVNKLGLPLFVKPNAGGSSFGITKVKRKEDLTEAVNKALAESDEVLIEQFIDGKEFTCGLVKIKGEKTIFPVTEVLPVNEFFDFEAKYTPGAAEEITPARLPEDKYKECQEISGEVYDLCQCSGIVRVDFILSNNEFYFLEINTTPGMTATSFIPQQIKAMGLELKDIITKIIESALN